jgi:hypothetical protein
MPAPWEKYQSQSSTSSSNDGPWNNYKAPEGMSRNKNTEVESALQGAAQGVSFGFADEIEGVGRAVKAAYEDPSKRNIKALGNSYKDFRDAARARYEMARADNPGSYTTGEVVGTIGSGFIPGLGLLNATKGIGITSKLIKAGQAGAIAGAGTSNADLTQGDFGGLATDAGVGAAAGAVTQGAISGAGKVLQNLTPNNVAKKTANVFLNTPEQITETYIANPQGVRNAPKRFELATSIEEQGISPLKKLVTEGSKESREQLKKEGLKFSTDDLAQYLKDKATDIANKAEGIIDDPQKAAAIGWLNDVAKKYKAAPTKEISANRLKDFIQTIDRSVDYDIGAGKFGKIDDTVKKEVRTYVDTQLKNSSPAYAQQMKQVASDASLLNDVNEVAQNPRGWSNAFRKLETDQYGSGQIPAETLRALDQRLGTNFVEQAKLSNAREAFDKSVTNGSRNVNLFSNFLRSVPILREVAPLIGGTVDKYGRELTLKAVDGAAKLNEIYNTKGLQAFRKDVGKLVDLAQKGNTTAAITLQFLSQANPQAMKAYEQQEAMKRKSQGQ